MRRILILCEGKTEHNYIQLINKLLNNKGNYSVRFTAINLDGLSFKNYKDKIYSKLKYSKIKAFDKIFVWIDFDIFKRSGSDCNALKEKILALRKNPKVLFNYMNGEDFLILHYSGDEIQKWTEICNKNNHFKIPLHGDEYVKLFKENIDSNYRKGGFSDLNLEKIKKVLELIQLTDYPQKSDISEILEIVIEEIENNST